MARAFPQAMGVINITPDSFSDGGQYFSLEGFSRRLEDLCSAGAQWIDIGAESTAPRNQAISFLAEKERISSTLLPYLREKDWPKGVNLSLDTYRLETFELLRAHLAEMGREEVPLVWNDVSGLLGPPILDYLKENSQCRYILGHTLVQHRDQVGDHLKFLSPLGDEDFLNTLVEHFQKASTLLRQEGLLHRVIFDPCFGFSKTRAQNLYLLQHLPRFIAHFPLQQPWLIGISRKSFLRPLLGPQGTLGEIGEETEGKHQSILAKWQQELPEHSLIFRVHDLKVIPPHPPEM